MSRAIVLLSGGLDSATVAAIAKADGFAIVALTVDYGQRHRDELEAAERVARHLGVEQHRSVRIDLGSIGGSALTSASIAVPKAAETTIDRATPLASEARSTRQGAEAVGPALPDRAPLPGGAAAIPVTYVPARNTMLLSIALGLAEVTGSFDLFFGANVLDYSGYPDCRPAFVEAFEALANVATKAAVEGLGRFRVHAPLLRSTKAEIIARGTALGVDYALTHSCYDPIAGRACGRCDACILRRRGFVEAAIPDPTKYA